MSQHNLSVANADGATVRAGFNSALQALATMQSGSSAPSTTYGYMLWADTSTSPATIKQRNGANSGWITLMQVDTATLNFLGGQFVKMGTALGSGPTYTSADKAALESTSGDTYLQLSAVASAIVGIGFSDTVRNVGALKYDHNTNTFTIRTNAADQVTIDSSGNVVTTGTITPGKAINEVKGSNIASATTTDIGAATGNFVDITGTTTITGLGTVAAGVERDVRFNGVLTLTHNATSLILPNGVSITTASGDTATFRSLGSGNWVCMQYTRADGSGVNEVKGSNIASATTTDIGAATGNFVDVTGTTTITGLGTIRAGVERTVRFTGALTLTHNATSLILPGGANITTANGDVATFRSLGSGNWVCTCYQKASGSAIAGGELKAKFSRRVASGTSEGNGTAGAWTKRTIDSSAIYNYIPGLSCSSDVFSIPDGKYRVTAKVSIYCINTASGGVKLRLRNTSDNTNSAIGMSEEYLAQATCGLQLKCEIFEEEFTISGGPKNHELQYYIQTLSSANTMGHAYSAPGISEVYTEIVFTKVS